MLESVEWGEYRLGDLFEIKNTSGFNKEVLTLGSEYDYVTRTSQNQGILQTTGFVNEENINEAGTWSLGLLQMDFFYRRRCWYAGQFVRKIVPKIELTDSSISFFTTILNKLKPILLSVLVRDVDTVFRNKTCLLPTRDGKIDFEFMEKFIAELKALRIAELKAYLNVTGLKDYTLTPEEEQAIKDFETGNVEWSEYRLGDLFEILSPKKRFDANKVIIGHKGYHYVVRTSQNNGIRGFIEENEEFLNEPNTISFGQDTATMYYQPKPYFTGDKIKVLKSRFTQFNHRNAQFFISCLQKPFLAFSWGANSFNVKVLEKQVLLLSTRDGEIDFEFMRTFISAIQKLVIKDVVLYAGREIEATKQVISKTI